MCLPLKSRIQKKPAGRQGENTGVGDYFPKNSAKFLLLTEDVPVSQDFSVNMGGA